MDYTSFAVYFRHQDGWTAGNDSLLEAVVNREEDEVIENDTKSAVQSAGYGENDYTENNRNKVCFEDCESHVAWVEKFFRPRRKRRHAAQHHHQAAALEGRTQVLEDVLEDAHRLRRVVVKR